MELLVFVAIILMAIAYWYQIWKAKKQRLIDVQAFRAMMEQNRKQTKIMERQIDNEGYQVELSKETADNMIKLLDGIGMLSEDMSEVKQGIQFLKSVMNEPNDEEPKSTTVAVD